MSESTKDDQPLEPKSQSLLRSSLLMASGTLVSRLLGFFRSAMLVAAIGAYGGVVDAFNTANTLPNMVYNLLAAGVLDAVLIPQIVRALKRKSGSEYLNKLLTGAGTILFAITVICMVAAPVLISIFGSSFAPQQRELAIGFALLCLPQIFFYGLYNLVGEVLNARGIFGPYMWAPVVNNIIAIIGLGAFLFMWGTSGETFAVESFTGSQMFVLAGTATAGVLCQALVLFIPLRKSGVKLKIDLKFWKADFGSASRVAGWTFATLAVSQLGVISTTNLANLAGSWADANGVAAASLGAYNYAFMIYMVPQSLISVTLATAIFTRLANNVADGDYQALANNYHTGVRLITMLSMLSVAVLMAAAHPLMQMLLPTYGSDVAGLYSSVLLALALGIPSTGIVLISQRVFFAFENVRPVFLMGIIPTVLQLIIGWGIYFFAPATTWTVGASIAETACRVLQGFIAMIWTASLVRTINAGKLISGYLLYLSAFAVSFLGGWLTLRLIGSSGNAGSTVGRLFDGAWRTTIVGIVVVIIYFVYLSLVSPNETAMMRTALLSRFSGRFKRAAADDVPPAGAELSRQDIEEDLTDTTTFFPTNDLTQAQNASHSAETPDQLVGEDEAAMSEEQVVMGEEALDLPHSGYVPTWDSIIAGDDSSRSLATALGMGTTTDTGQIPIRSWERQHLDHTHEPERLTVMNASDAKKPEQTGQRTFNPTGPAIGFGIVIVILGGIFAWTNLTSSSHPGAAPDLEQSSQSETAQSVENRPEAPQAKPEIASVDVFSWNDDGKDHPELAEALLDGDPNTLWYTRYYDWNQFEDNNMIALLVKLKQDAVVSQISLDVQGEGGELIVRAAQDGNPRTGDILARSPLSAKTVIKLPEPTKLSEIGLVFATLPTDDEGLSRAKVSGLSVE